MLGSTKGSFYWHFANRDELLQAALGRWEVLATERLISSVESSGEPGGGEVASVRWIRSRPDWPIVVRSWNCLPGSTILWFRRWSDVSPSVELPSWRCWSIWDGQAESGTSYALRIRCTWGRCNWCTVCPMWFLAVDRSGVADEFVNMVLAR